MEGPGPPARHPLSFPRCRAERERGDFISAAEGVHELCLEFSSPAPLPTCPIHAHRLVLGKPKGAGEQVCWPLSTSTPQHLCPGGLGRSLSFPRRDLALGPRFPLFLPLLWSLQSTDPRRPLLHPRPPPGAPSAPLLPQDWPPAGLIAQHLPRPSSPLPGGLWKEGIGRDVSVEIHSYVKAMTHVKAVSLQLPERAILAPRLLHWREKQGGVSTDPHHCLGPSLCQPSLGLPGPPSHLQEGLSHLTPKILLGDTGCFSLRKGFKNRLWIPCKKKKKNLWLKIALSI